jgi:DNA-binding NarL/FixJ family response regulator
MIGPVQDLTRRQVDVLELAAQGLSNSEIAMRLGVTESTVKTHLRAAYERLGATSRAHAVANYLRGTHA